MNQKAIENFNKLTKEQKAQLLASSAIEHLAKKHNVSEKMIVAAMEAKNEKILRQFSELVAFGIITFNRA